MTGPFTWQHRIVVLLSLVLGCAVSASAQTGKPAGNTTPPAAPWTLDCVEDFPTLAADPEGHTWLAVLARPAAGPEIRIYAIDGDTRKLAYTLGRTKMTGVDRPAFIPLAKGCLLAFAAEADDRWQICYASISASSSAPPTLRVIDAPGKVNVKPVLAAAGQDVWVAWESNAGSTRGIYACRLTGESHGPIQRLSADDAVSNNPAIVATADGALFAAWDSIRDHSADLYGAWCRQGRWNKEQRLTKDPRINRHVSLAARGTDVWLAWQAQSFQGQTLNNLREQRIVVARLEGDRLMAPTGLFEHVSSPKDLILRPRITFDPQGRLWLTARRSLGAHAGWQAIAWSYAGSKWSEPQGLWPDQGRWRPVDIAFLPDHAIAAVQRDSLPRAWQVDVGIAPDWHSEVAVVPVNLKLGPAPAPLKTEPLALPPTSFSLEKHMRNQSADLPRQSETLLGKKLNCYWGDLHEHTDLSVCNRAMNPPADDLYANQRDIERADFTALTDHGFNYDHPQWAYNGERTRVNNDPPRFVALLGQEWTSQHVEYQPKRSYRRYGHHNLIYKDPYFNRWFDAYDGDINPQMLWDQLRGVEYVCIPHQLADTGNAPVDWSFHDESRQTVAEIFQNRGSYEYLGCPRQANKALPEKGHFLQDAWEQGLVIGVIASPDHGGGAGKAGVWAEQLSPDGIVDALLARHSFGTSGAKFSLLVRSGDVLMGEKVARGGPGPIAFKIRCVTDRPIARVVLLRNNQVIREAEFNQPAVDLDWTDAQPPDEPRLWYYVRVHRADDQLAWSSPIWFMKNQPAK